MVTNIVKTTRCNKYCVANAFLANLGHLVFKVFRGSMDPLMVPPSIVLASVFKGSDSQCAKKCFCRI